MYPTADQIAHAIVAACRITGADPVAVVSRETDAPCETFNQVFPIARARSYAALAIQAAFPALPRAAVDRVVGCRAGTIGVFLGGLNRRIREGECSTWYHPDKLRAVVEAIPPAPAHVPMIPEIRLKPPPRPPSTRVGPASPLPPRPPQFGKRRLEDELRQAILNTGGKPV